jgi:hypothetical protein
MQITTHKRGYGSQKGELVHMRIDDEVLFWKTPLENGPSCDGKRVVVEAHGRKRSSNSLS